MHLHISPVYSAYHPTAKVGGVRLLQHQVDSLEAMQDQATDVIINTAMTGDGKSLAAYLPAFQDDQCLVAMYPTNELVRDQYSSLEKYRDALNLNIPRYDTMYSDYITQLMREHQAETRLDEVKKLLKRNKILLTNPDLIHLIMSHQYGWDFMRKELPVLTSANFDYFVFDEFHVFGPPQVVSVVNMLSYLTAYYALKPQERKKYVFLSATPNTRLEGMLNKIGLRTKIIEGHYQASSQPDINRCILQGCDVTISATDQQSNIEQWVEEHLDELRGFFKEYPTSKAAILVYSPATARRLVQRLKQAFGQQITVGENSGLLRPEERREALSKQILVGTSTVDVGIDFHINYLIFEAFDAGSFLQRFGRLGRHDEFPCYRAHALVPNFVLERLGLALTGQQEIERTRFNTAVREAFPTEQEFALYANRWGVIQAADVVNTLQSQSKLDASHAFTKELTAHYERVYGQPEKPALPKAIKKYYRLGKQAPSILADLLSFRGQNPLSCGVWDTTTANPEQPGGRLLTYDLFFLLTNTQFEVMEKEEFLQEVQRRHLDEREFQHQLLYIKIHSYVPERLNLILHLNLPISETPNLTNHITALPGIQVREPRHVWRDQVNKKLRDLKLSCTISDMNRQELKGILKLGGVFPIYRLQDQLGYDYSVSFGQEALLLDSLLFMRKPKNDHYMQA